MPYVNAERVQETSTTTGTGTYNLGGASSAAFRTFVDGVGDGNYCPYLATMGNDWEIGVGLVTDAATDTLARTSVLKSSNANAAVSWAAGTKTISCVPLGDVGSNRLLGRLTLSGAAASIGTIIVPVGVTRIWGHVFVIAPGALVPRILLGAGSIDTTAANYGTANCLPNTGQINQLGTAAGFSQLVAAMANGNELMSRFEIYKQSAGRVARGSWQSTGMTTAPGTALVMSRGGGIWNNTTDLIQRIEVHGYSSLTSAVDANMSAGSEFLVYGSYD